MAPEPINRNEQTPFFLQLFYRTTNLHRLGRLRFTKDARTEQFVQLTLFRPEEFMRDAPRPRPSHVQVYTWMDCTLAELTKLLTHALPDILPSPAIGTRLYYQLIYENSADYNSRQPGRYLSKPLGSVMVRAGEHLGKQDGEEQETRRFTGLEVAGDADKTLSDARFVIGDYIAVTIMPPGPDGEVQPPPQQQQQTAVTRGPIRDHPSRDYGRRESVSRENGYHPYARPRGGRGRYNDLGRSSVPSGEWRRGDVPPGERSRGAPYYRANGRSKRSNIPWALSSSASSSSSDTNTLI